MGRGGLRWWAQGAEVFPAIMAEICRRVFNRRGDFVDGAGGPMIPPGYAQDEPRRDEVAQVCSRGQFLREQHDRLARISRGRMDLQWQSLTADPRALHLSRRPHCRRIRATKAGRLELRAVHAAEERGSGVHLERRPRRSLVPYGPQDLAKRPPEEPVEASEHDDAARWRAAQKGQRLQHKVLLRGRGPQRIFAHLELRQDQKPSPMKRQHALLGDAAGPPLSGLREPVRRRRRDRPAPHCSLQVAPRSTLGLEDQPDEDLVVVDPHVDVAGEQPLVRVDAVGELRRLPTRQA